MSMLARYFGCRCCLVALFLGLALVVLPTPARAQETDGGGSAQASSTASATGFITLLLTGEANGSGSTMTGGEISLYCVATVDRSDSPSGVYSVSNGQFALSKSIEDLGTLTKEQLDARNPTISEALEKDVRAKQVNPLQTEGIEDGAITFSDLNEGLYLLVQTTPSDGNRTLRPFMMSVPNEAGELGVVAKPKPDAWDGVDSPKEDNPQKDNKADAGSAIPQNQKTTPATTSTPLVEHRVPATGDRTYSFVLTAAIGAGLVVVGARGRHAKRMR